MTDEPRFLMVIAGDGVGRERLAALAGGLGNVRFLPLQSTEVFNAFLGMADVHLLPQKSEVADLVMPSKLPGMLASGRPVIVGAMPGTQLAQEVEGSGIAVRPGHPEEMATAVRVLMAAPQECRRLGAHAAERARNRWAKNEILSQFERQLVALARKR